MHDLVHDLAEYVAGDEIVRDGTAVRFTDRVLHASVLSKAPSLSAESWEAPSWLLCSLSQMRSILLRSRSITIENKNSTYAGLISKCRSLRALDLKSSGICIVPDSISRLRHLRYLSLSKNPIKCLPDAITRLVNLQTLNLGDCHHLEELPRGFTRLLNLRHLNIYSCPFIDMPSGFGLMKSLTKLNMFVVGKSNGVDALPATNLSGPLNLRFHRWRSDAVTEARLSSLKVNQQLTRLSLDLNFKEEDTAPLYSDVEELLECFRLPPSLKFLSIDGYSGLRFPNWMVNELPCLLSKLVYVRIENCRSCQLLPQFSQLAHLKSLYLSCLEALEYMADIWSSDGVSSSAGCFPLLEELDLSVMPKLKGWLRVEDDNDVIRPKLLLPRLSKLRIEECPKLMSMPLMPRLQTFYAQSVHGKFLKSFLLQPTLFALKKLRVSFVDELVSFPCNNLCNLESLSIGWCDSLRNLLDQQLHFLALRKLEIIGSEELNLWEMTSSYVRAWEGLKSLHSLCLSYNSRLDCLPDGLGCLTMLRQLEIASFGNLTALPEQIGLLSQLRLLRISSCPKLASFPQSFCGLTSLQELSVVYCPLLERRCQEPDGEDQTLIQHIPLVHLGRQ